MGVSHRHNRSWSSLRDVNTSCTCRAIVIMQRVKRERRAERERDKEARQKLSAAATSRYRCGDLSRHTPLRRGRARAMTKRTRVGNAGIDRVESLDETAEVPDS